MAARKSKPVPKTDAFGPPAHRVSDSLPPNTAARLLACWALLEHATHEIVQRCDGSTKLQRALDDVERVRDALAAISGNLANHPGQCVADGELAVAALAAANWRPRHKQERGGSS